MYLLIMSLFFSRLQINCQAYRQPFNRQHPSFFELVLSQEVGVVLLSFNVNSNLGARKAVNAAIANLKAGLNCGVVRGSSLVGSSHSRGRMFCKKL